MVAHPHHHAVRSLRLQCQFLHGRSIRLQAIHIEEPDRACCVIPHSLSIHRISLPRPYLGVQAAFARVIHVIDPFIIRIHVFQHSRLLLHLLS